MLAAVGHLYSTGTRTWYITRTVVQQLRKIKQEVKNSDAKSQF
jgi:hypothetical protein